VSRSGDQEPAIIGAEIKRGICVFLPLPVHLGANGDTGGGFRRAASG
jgi:hypothetical protein